MERHLPGVFKEQRRDRHLRVALGPPVDGQLPRFHPVSASCLACLCPTQHALRWPAAIHMKLARHQRWRYQPSFARPVEHVLVRCCTQKRTPLQCRSRDALPVYVGPTKWKLTRYVDRHDQGVQRLCSIWSVSANGNLADADCRELRRGPQGNKPHSGTIDFLVMPRDGQVNCVLWAPWSLWLTP